MLDGAVRERTVLRQAQDERVKGLAGAFVGFQPVRAELACVAKLPLAMGVGEGGKADIAEAGTAAADEDRCAVERQAVDQPGGEKGGSGPCPAFDQQMLDRGVAGEL
jgi:hypothetical protein